MDSYSRASKNFSLQTLKLMGGRPSRASNEMTDEESQIRGWTQTRIDADNLAWRFRSGTTKT